MELTDNILWLLKQAFYFSLTTVTKRSAATASARPRSACCANSPMSPACPAPNSPGGC